ncbi:hypothetical protein WMY93_007561 [Mugilogobius chulae]|uniref:Uncharacterized protein n=1 Tax=Mugilogobius chulae TaxID=88201 RepID=A0AAW0PES6_9GOBI
MFVEETVPSAGHPELSHMSLCRPDPSFHHISEDTQGGPGQDLGFWTNHMAHYQKEKCVMDCKALGQVLIHVMVKNMLYIYKLSKLIQLNSEDSLTKPVPLVGHFHYEASVKSVFESKQPEVEMS